MSIQRYTYDSGTLFDPCVSPFMRDDDTGDYVTYDDHLAELTAERERAARLEAERDSLFEESQRRQRARLLAEAERDALRERVARLVAENGEITDLNQTQFLELEHLRRISDAAHRLYDESEEYDFDDGLGRGAPQELWDALSAEIDTMTDAQRTALEGK